MYAAHHDVLRILNAMAKLDPDGVGQALARSEQRRADGMAYLGGRLAEQGLLRSDVNAEHAAHVIWVLASFDAYDLLATGRGLGTQEIVHILVDMAEQSLLAWTEPPPRRRGSTRHRIAAAASVPTILAAGASGRAGCALKTDLISLTAFVGLCAWMAFMFFLFLDRDHVTPADASYWLLMQVGMILGLATSYPANAWMIRRGLKEAMSERPEGRDYDLATVASEIVDALRGVRSWPD